MEYWSTGNAEEQEPRVSTAQGLARRDRLLRVELSRLWKLSVSAKQGGFPGHESLERKKLSGDWIDQLVVKESNGVYGG
jgi:hypothetical protein